MNILQGERSGGLCGVTQRHYGAYQTQISHRGLHTDHRLWQLFISGQLLGPDPVVA